MIDERDLEQAERVFAPPDGSFDRFLRRRDRKRRNQRIAAGVVGIAIFVAAIWIVTSVSSLDRTQTPAVPGAVTGPTETGPTETGPSETGPFGHGGQGAGSLPVSVTDYLVDLETGARTPLPESIVGTEDVTSDYAVSPDGSRLAYVRRGGNGAAGIFVANLDGTGIEQATVELPVEARPSGRAGSWHTAAWAPDGSKIAYVGRGGNVYLLDLATGVSTQVTYDPGAEWPTFSPDGSSILYHVWRGDVGEVRIVLVAGGESERVLVGGDSNVEGTPQLSPDGSLLSYACGESWPYDLCLANADGTDARVLVGGVGLASWSPDGTRIAYSTWSTGVYVVEVATGEVTAAGEGASPTWLDGHTLIVEADHCSLPPHGRCPF